MVSLQNYYTTFLRTCKGKNEEKCIFFWPFKINQLRESAILKPKIRHFSASLQQNMQQIRIKAQNPIFGDSAPLSDLNSRQGHFSI
jgi:hypothetical protein